MNYFVSEAEAFAKLPHPPMQVESSSTSAPVHDEYVSPLSAQPKLPQKHYNNASSKEHPNKIVPNKKKFGGFCDVCQLQVIIFLGHIVYTSPPIKLQMVIDCFLIIII